MYRFTSSTREEMARHVEHRAAPAEARTIGDVDRRQPTARGFAKLSASYSAQYGSS